MQVLVVAGHNALLGRQKVGGDVSCVFHGPLLDVFGEQVREYPTYFG